MIWNTIDVVSKCGGYAVVSKTGSFVKAAAITGTIYGGEMSAHHYFKDFAYRYVYTLANDLATFIRGREIPF